MSLLLLPQQHIHCSRYIAADLLEAPSSSNFQVDNPIKAGIELCLPIVAPGGEKPKLANVQENPLNERHQSIGDLLDNLYELRITPLTKSVWSLFQKDGEFRVGLKLSGGALTNCRRGIYRRLKHHTHPKDEGC
jgi:hypothetical protein